MFMYIRISYKMSVENVCNGKISNLPSLEVVRKVQKTLPYVSNLNWFLHIHYVRQDYDFCKSIIEKQFKEYLNPEYLYYVKGLIEKHEGNLHTALQNFQRAVEINSNNIEIIKEIGKTLYTMGRVKQSLQVFKNAESMINHSDHEIYYYIGEILYRNVENQKLSSSSLSNDNINNMNEAKKYLQKSVIYGKKLESYKLLANIYEIENDYSKAIEILENCLQISPENTSILANIGVLYLKLNQTDKAFNRLNEIKNIDENCSNGLIAYGAILQSRNDIDGALTKYAQVTNDDKKSAELWNNIGLCFLKKKKLVLAIACLKKSSWLSPLNYNCLYNLSLIYITAEQYATAFHTLAAAINLRRDNPEIYMLLGICLRKLDDTDNAFMALEKSINLPYQKPKNPLLLLNFAIICYETNKIDRAAIAYNSFIKAFHNVPLPIEYKFCATKLKSLLQRLAPDKLSDSFNKSRNNTKMNDDDDGDDGDDDGGDKENENCSAASSEI